MSQDSYWGGITALRRLSGNPLARVDAQPFIEFDMNVAKPASTSARRACSVM
jgi:hypothetical protein